MQHNRLDFAAAITLIDKEVVDLTAESDLFGSKTFILFYENPEIYYDDAMLFIASEKYTAQQKIIAARAMCRLPWKRYVGMVSRLWKLQQSNMIGAQLFESLSFPVYNWNTTIAEHYDDQEVRELLTEIAGSKKVENNLHDYIIQDLLTGKAREHIRELREAGQIK